MESGCAGHRPNVCLHTACRLPPNSDGYQRGGPSHEEKRSLNIETKSHTESNNSMTTLTFGSNYPMKAISNNTRPRYRCGKTWLELVVAAAVYLLGNGQAYARGRVGVGRVGVGVAGVGIGRVGVAGVGIAPGLAVAAATLPRGYYAAVPAGYSTVVYHGSSCRYVGGIYYRAVMYQGSTAWVVVT